MAVAQLIAVGGLALAVVGSATATDAVSLRELAHAVNVPVLSGAILLAREAMPNSVAHMLEPLAAVVGFALGGASCFGWLRVTVHALARERAGRVFVYPESQPLQQLAA